MGPGLRRDDELFHQRELQQQRTLEQREIIVGDQRQHGVAFRRHKGVDALHVIDFAAEVRRENRGTVDQRARAGIGWVPQERNIFRSLTVEENMTAVAQPGPWTVERVWEMFPRLKERRHNFGNQLSGGEQQMLAIGRALTLNPKVLLLDEPTEGLAPIIVDELLAALGKITRAVGICSIIVEQNARKILGLADRVVILERGAIVHDAPSAAMKDDPAVLERFLGVAGAAENDKSRAAKLPDPRN